MSAETVEDVDDGPRFDWRLDRGTRVLRAVPAQHAARQERLRWLLKFAEQRPDSPAPAPVEYTLEEMHAGRRAVERHKRGTGPAPTDGERARFRAYERYRKGCRIDRSVPAITLVLELVEAGRTLGEIAAIRGVQPASVIKNLERADRLDVIRRLTGVVA